MDFKLTKIYQKTPYNELENVSCGNCYIHFRSGSRFTVVLKMLLSFQLYQDGLGISSQTWAQVVKIANHTVSIYFKSYILFFVEFFSFNFVLVFKNEYIFGDCKNKNNALYEHVHKTIDEVQKASIIRVVLLFTIFFPL